MAGLVAEVALLMRERRALKPMGGQLITPFTLGNRAAVLRLRKEGTPAYPVVGPSQFGLRKYPVAEPGSVVFPLGGISRTMTHLCAADGREVRYVSDDFGFANPRGLWSRPVRLVLIGDSFVHGICVPEQSQIPAGIRRIEPATLSLGIVGAGPLAQLAMLREYAAALRPARILWFFYEGNDVEELAAEKISPLRAYLDSGYSQGLSRLQDSIDGVLRRYADSVLATGVRLPPIRNELPELFLLPRVRLAVASVAANAPGMSAHPEFPLLEKVLLAAQRETSSWGGEIVMVYLPDYHRFDRTTMTFAGWVHNNDEIHRRAIGAARAAGMRVIDVSASFAADPNPRRFWPTPTSHYGPEGYELVVRTVAEALSTMD